ncbi:MAG TPA: DoxX family protein [Myxococcaceae bacterium]|nr:DoxX family protein [Myxococcaceae bacterium]
MDIGLLVLRLAVGLTMAAHGGQKLFGWFGGHGLGGTGGFLESLGFRPGRVQAALAGGGEMVGGLLLALGLVTPVGAAIVLAVMVVATVSVHLGKGFFLSDGGAEYNVLIMAATAALAFTGPGAYSLDAVDGLGVSGWRPGVLAIVVGLVLGAGALAARRPVPVAGGA